MDKTKASFLFCITIIFTLFSFEISLAKSTNKKEFVSMGNKAFYMIKEKSNNLYTKKFSELVIQIDKEFDIEKIKFKKKGLKKYKAEILVYICQGYKNIYKTLDMKLIIDKCKRANNYYEKNNLYTGDKAEYKQFIHNILGEMYSWQFYIDGDKKNYKNAIKFSKINLEDVRKKDLFYSNALKNHVIIYRVSSEYKKAIKYQKLNLENWDCFKKISELPIRVQKRCMLDLSDYAVLHMDLGGYENEKKAKKLLMMLLATKLKIILILIQKILFE